MRKFEELIQEIEHDWERFVPIEEIAKLAFFREISKEFSPK